VLQIDSDDQCDPCFFKEFWDKREKQQVIYGFRKTRDDGWFRLVASRLISLYIYLFTLKYCKDPNVPYRLYSNKALSKVIDLNYDVNLSNMLLTYRIQETYCIQWVSIHFRDRLQGSSSHKIIKSLALIGQIIIRLLNDK
jgi:hypothetical protein